MTITATIVETLHRINRQKADLQGQLKRGPQTIAAAENRLKLARELVQKIRDQITKMRLAVDSKQLQMREREDKIHKWQGMQNAAKENREYQALKDQIAADTKANEVLSDEILELLEAIDETNIQLQGAQQKVDEYEQEHRKVLDQINSRRAVLESELARVENELKSAEQSLTGEFKREYERMVSAKGEDAMAELDDRCCSGCCKSLTPMLLDRLLMGQSIVCPNCGRLVYKRSES